jgi:hypothetical protein
VEDAMNVARISLMLMRVGAAIQLILGIGFWTGHWITAIPLHRTIGTIYVLLLWVIAIVALVRKSNVGLAVFAIVWGVVIAGLGMMQTTLLVGDMHWIIRVLHLVIALSAMPIAERLARPTLAS